MRRGERYPVEILTRAEVEALLKACGRSRTGHRNRALLALLWRCGLRVSEARSLEPRDVDLKRGTVRVRHGKGDRSRTVGLDALASGALEAWLRVRPAGGTALLCTLDGAALYSSYPRNLLKRLARRAGIDKRVHPHGLRHAYAVELVQEGASVVFVRDLLGHASIATTDGYLRGLGASPAVAFARGRR